MISFSVSTNILIQIFQTQWARCLKALLIHFPTPRSLLMKVLFTFLTPNWTFLRHTRLICRCMPPSSEFVCAGFFLMGPLLNSFSIMRHQIYIIWWHKSFWCPYSSCCRIQMCRLGSLRLFFFFLFKDYMWLYVKCGQSPEAWSWQSRMLLSRSFRGFWMKLPSSLSAFHQGLYFCALVTDEISIITTVLSPQPMFWGTCCHFQHKYSIDVMQPIIKKIYDISAVIFM